MFCLTESVIVHFHQPSLTVIFRHLQTTQCTLHIHSVPKKGATQLMWVTSSNLNRFSKKFHHCKERNFQ